MKPMKPLIYIACALLPLGAWAQNELDALRYSQLQFNSSPRALALSGSMGAVGGDWSVISSNPAGLGLFSDNQAGIALGLNYNRNFTLHYGNREESEAFRMSLPQLGVSFDLTQQLKDKNWTRLNLAINHNSLANFNQTIYFEGENNSTNLGYFARDLAEGFDFSDLGGFTALAFNSYLIDTINGSRSSYFTNTPYLNQRDHMEWEERGSVSETAIALAAQYKQWLNIGATVGFSNIDYAYESRFWETNHNDTSVIQEVYYNENFSTEGNGVNLKIGALISPQPWVRIGFALHTPTWYYSMYDSYDQRMTTVDGVNSTFGDAITGEVFYRLRTPGRQMASLGFIYKRKGFLSFEVERVDYGAARLNNKFLGDYNYRFENDIISDSYREALNYRMGAEYRLGRLSLRAGIAYQDNAYQSEQITDNSVWSHSLGFGVQGKRLRWDFGYAYRRAEYNTRLYNDSFLEASGVIDRSSQFSSSISWKF